MDKEGEVESLYTRIPNDEDFLEQDCPQIDVDEEVEEPNVLRITCSDEELDGDESSNEELDGDEKFEETEMIGGNEKVEEPRMIGGNEKVEEPGVNHHGQSILFGAGLLSNEDTDTFVWLFEAWLKCMNYKAPSAIITDQDRAMKNAIEIVFPKTRHRYCLWHIMRKVTEKLSGYEHYDQIKMALNICVYDSPNVDDFEGNWKSLIESYELQNNPWLNTLYSERTFWVLAYMKDTFWAGMTTTQRSESMNSFFDNYVHAQTTLKEFVDQFDNALKKMVEREARADFDCYNRTSPCVTDFALEKQFQDAYTNAKFKEVQAEFKPRSNVNNCLLKSEGAISTYQVIETDGNRMMNKTFSVFFNTNELEVKCTCALFEVRGIICRHSISVLLTSGVTMLPPRYILDRWRKDINRKHVLIKSSGDVLVNKSNAQRYDEFCKHCEELALLTSKKVKYFMEAMKSVDMLTEKYRALTLVEPNQCDEVIPICDEVLLSNEGTTVQSEKVLTPVKATKKGRPRFLRMVPVIEKVTKKSQGKKSQRRNKQQGKNTVNKQRKKKKVHNLSQDDLNTSQTSLPHTTQGSINVAATMVDPMSELPKLISQHKYEEAFVTAFRRCDVSIVYWLCSQVDLQHILSIYPIPLSQVVLLHLLRHLTYGININMPHTFGWMISVANAIIPTDPMIATQVQPIFNEVYAVLNHRQYLPTITGDELSSIRSLIHVIMSKSM
ncbi:protein FAR-RED IMPAIRED RESPONSE 1-like [Corylus avellana]|uniref:protein FAR-RED IMPAIRED RESPONSE 1-like n=1 Tax=Corylus avellana TaxID=13451 RepID=UPI00286AD288|nr:protein FAR-RED IMPAIRED RESPONSE 1-like [Corylus avellana]